LFKTPPKNNFNNYRQDLKPCKRKRGNEKKFVENMVQLPIMKRLLLHICCAPDGVYIPEKLKDEFNITCYFYNPNIYPESEYEKRANEMKKVAESKGYKLIIASYNPELFLHFAKPLFYLPEKQGRCVMCVEERMSAVAKYGFENGFDIFGTVLTVSPKKIVDMINEAGFKASKKFNIEYLPSDFKKKDGYRLSVLETKKMGLYRQDYCGCESSLVYRQMFKNACNKPEVCFFTGNKIGIYDIQSVKKYIERKGLKTGFVFYKTKPTVAVFKESYNERIFLEPFENLEWRMKIFDKKGITVININLKEVVNRDIFIDPC
jgi:predicted adenine nucleotide alpha hydrolase (AANH) superfamily ATPase